MSESNNEKHKILIVGGGAAGLELATTLGNKLGKAGLAEINLIDASSTHIWKPLLHEVAAGTLDETEQVDYLAQAYRSHFRFRLGKMAGLRREKKEVYLSPTYSDSGEELIPERTFKYDTLVMAVGSISNTFNIKGWPNTACFSTQPRRPSNFKSNWSKLISNAMSVKAAARTNRYRSRLLAPAQPA